MADVTREIDNLDDRFSEVFGSMQNAMMFQASMLESSLNIQRVSGAVLISSNRKLSGISDLLEQMNQKQSDAARDRERAGAFDGDKPTPSPANLPDPPENGGERRSEGFSFVGLGGKIATLLGGGALFALAAAFNEEIVGFAEGFADEMFGKTDFNKAFAEATVAAGTFGILGGLFGKRVGAIFAGAAAGNSLGGSLFDGLDEDKDGIITAFGLEFGKEDFAAVGTALGGSLGLFLPSILSAAIGPIFAAMTGPVGLVALSAAAIFTGVHLFDKWVKNRRKEVIDSVNEEIENGLDKLAKESDRTFWDKVRVGIFGAGKGDSIGDRLQVLVSEAESEMLRQVGDVMDPSQIPDKLDISSVQDESLREQFTEMKENLQKAISGGEEALSAMSMQKLEQLRRATQIFGLTDESKILDTMLEKRRPIENRLIEEEKRRQKAAGIQATNLSSDSDDYSSLGVGEMNPFGTGNYYTNPMAYLKYAADQEAKYGMTKGTPLQIDEILQGPPLTREDFDSWRKTAKREDREFANYLKERGAAASALLPPIVSAPNNVDARNMSQTTNNSTVINNVSDPTKSLAPGMPF